MSDRFNTNVCRENGGNRDIDFARFQPSNAERRKNVEGQAEGVIFAAKHLIRLIRSKSRSETFFDSFFGYKKRINFGNNVHALPLPYSLQ
ncbi:hypothetical protein KKC44_02510 [Patescibacteria group bacterium]|nr:hypothetical protein [Patescibacteria group bacterium]